MPARAGSRPFGALARRGLVSVFDAMASLGDQRGPFKAQKLRAISLLADGANGDETLPWPRAGFALRQHFGLGIYGVADEHRRGQLDVGPAEIGDRLLAD